jgi:hypothetical protein
VAAGAGAVAGAGEGTGEVARDGDGDAADIWIEGVGPDGDWITTGEALC